MTSLGWVEPFDSLERTSGQNKSMKLSYACVVITEPLTLLQNLLRVELDSKGTILKTESFVFQTNFKWLENEKVCANMLWVIKS